MKDHADKVRPLVIGMRSAIDDYEDGHRSLDRLVWDLKSRISALQDIADEAWVEELRSRWWNLEYVNAFWIESGRSGLTEDEHQRVNEALEELRPMLSEY